MAFHLRHRHSIWAIALWLATALPAAALPADLDLSARDLQTVERGDIVVHLRNTNESTLKDVLCVGTIKASPEQVWSVLVDYDHYGQIFPRILKSEIRARSGDSEDHYTLLHYPWPFRDRWLVNRISHASNHRAINWHRIDGSVKEVMGSWRLIPEGDQTLVVYKVRLDPGIPFIPTWAINWGSEKMAPDIIRAIRRRVKTP